MHSSSVSESVSDSASGSASDGFDGSTVVASGPQWAKGWKDNKKVTADPTDDGTAESTLHVATDVTADVAAVKEPGASDEKRRVAPGYDPATWREPLGTGRKGRGTLSTFVRTP